MIADGENDPDWLAADLLAQAEHDPAAQSILMTNDAVLAEAVGRAVERQLKTLPRAETAAASWRDYGAVILVRDFDEAIPLADRLGSRTPRNRGRRSRASAARGAQRRGHLHRSAYARGDLATMSAAKPCAADRTVGTVLVRAIGPRFRQAHIDPQVRPTRSPSWGRLRSPLPRRRGLMPTPARSRSGSIERLSALGERDGASRNRDAVCRGVRPMAAYILRQTAQGASRHHGFF